MSLEDGETLEKHLGLLSRGVYVGVNYHSDILKSIDMDDVFETYLNFCGSRKIEEGYCQSASYRSRFDERYIFPSSGDAHSFIDEARRKFPDHTFIITIDPKERMNLKLVEFLP